MTAVPDIVGMLLMMGVLVWLRRRHTDEAVDFWLLGLFFILFEVVSAAIFRSSGVAHSVTHMAALDAYVLAGVAFGWGARRDLLPGKSHFPFLLLPAVPMFLLCTIYGLDITSRTAYIAITIASLVAGALVLLSPRAGSVRVRLSLFVVHMSLWAPALMMAFNGQFRWVVYWCLTCLYLLVAFSFRHRAQRGKIGGVIIVAGFTIWAACFLLHPFVRGHPIPDGLVEQFWTMQKFVVILGMLLILLEDETERRKAEAMHDSLTGLPNRRLFEDRLSQALERSLRSGRSAALFLLDLDNFKVINDTLGHAAGDLALRTTAEQLQLKVRSSDTLARCGGDEFCIIVNDLTRREDCARIVQTLRDAVSNNAPPEWGLAASVGFALFPDDATSSAQLFAVADSRMYQQKVRTQQRKQAPEENAEPLEEPVLLKRQIR